MSDHINDVHDQEIHQCPSCGALYTLLEGRQCGCKEGEEIPDMLFDIACGLVRAEGNRLLSNLKET